MTNGGFGSNQEIRRPGDDLRSSVKPGRRGRCSARLKRANKRCGASEAANGRTRVVVPFEPLAIAVIRSRIMGGQLADTIIQVVVEGAAVFAIGVCLGQPGFRQSPPRGGYCPSGRGYSLRYRKRLQYCCSYRRAGRRACRGSEVLVSSTVKDLTG